jgi:hypothetical protein
MTNRHGHSVWTSGPRPGTCRFCGEANADEAYTCPELKPRVAAREARAREARARANRPA